VARYVRTNLVGFLALFVALGGTGYAAFKLPRHSVTQRALKTGAVNSRVVKNRSIKASDLARGVVRTGPTGATGAQGTQGLKGDKGDVGPTEGGSSDLMPELTREVALDQTNFTTRTPGRLFVSRTLNDLSVNCSAGDWATWLEVDGVRVPGTVVGGGVTGSLDPFTVNGVTTDVIPAGTHTSRFAVDCATGNAMSTSYSTDSDLTYVVLGNG
jgi:hypothetical protein